MNAAAGRRPEETCPVCGSHDMAQLTRHPLRFRCRVCAFEGGWREFLRAILDALEARS